MAGVEDVPLRSAEPSITANVFEGSFTCLSIEAAHRDKPGFSSIMAEKRIHQIVPHEAIETVTVPGHIDLSRATENVVRTGACSIVVRLPVKAIFKCFPGFQRIKTVLPAPGLVPRDIASFRETAGLWELPLVVVGVKTHQHADLTHVRHAADVFGLVFRLAEGGQQQSRQNRDDRNYIDLKKLIS